MTADIEATLARHIVRRAAVVGPLLVGGAWVLRGSDGAVAAAIGVAVVVGNFLLSGIALSMAARISLTLYHAAALVGFLLRLVLITVVMLGVARLFDIDRVAFGVAVIVSYLVLLTLEAAAVARGRERELEWTS
ncbi:MAG: hypothetical protein A2Z12_09535 [Actinobacteria bacterium RBG_16_68_21]|nr:MAG: hypothetical protein A2Z12_09535 [Actinobacteria bacterium RBG_16_68_21]